MLFFSPSLNVGASGVRYGIPNDFRFDSFIKKQINVNITPTIPRVVAPSIKNSLYHLMPFIISGSVNGNADMAVSDTTIIIIGETNPAFTAASPRINAPTIERALLLKLGILKSLSLNISKDIIIINVSKKAGNGTDSLWEAMFINKSVGNISWLNVVIAIYNAGVNREIKNAIYLIILVKLTFMLLPYGSSALKKKSFKTAGNIMAYGEPSTSIAILPRSNAFATLSGLWVVIIVGNTDLFSFSIKFLIFPLAVIPSISISFSDLSTLLTNSFLHIPFIYKIVVFVLVYVPMSLLIVQRLLSLILLLTNPTLVCISSINESSEPLRVVSVLGGEMLLDNSFFVSNARYLLFSKIIIVKPLFK